LLIARTEPYRPRGELRKQSFDLCADHRSATLRAGAKARPGLPSPHGAQRGCFAASRPVAVRAARTSASVSGRQSNALAARADRRQQRGPAPP
jgi:hypothetical protein